MVVVGSGPGGLQTSYALSRLGIDHALLSRDDAPGGMFQKWPIFQRLLSWTKTDAPYARTEREYEWYDHNSLVADEPENRGLAAEFLDRSWMVPSVPEMTAQLQAFATRSGVRVRTGCTWESTSRSDEGFVLGTSDGEYRCRIAIFAVGVTEPLKSDIAGIEDVPHYAEARTDKESYRGRRVVVIGKRNSGFELADALVPWAAQVHLVSPRPVAADVIALSTVRVRYLQPFEDHAWGGGTFAVNAAVERIERGADGWRVLANGTTHEGQIVLEADDVIAATGFRTPLLDLPSLGCATVRQGVLPAQTHHWESATVPGIYFAGNATQAAAGLRKHGVASASGTVSGFRYNARLLAERIAEVHFARRRPRRLLASDDVAPLLAAAVARSPELWAQKSYLAHVVRLDGEDGPVDEGIQPLAAFLDEDGPARSPATVEMNSEGEIYPALYLRQGSSIHEDTCPPHPLHAFDGPGYTKHVDSLVGAAAMTEARPRLAAWGALFTLPLVGLAVLLAVPRLDVTWENHPAHFWLVLGAAAVTAVLAYATGEAARRRGDARLFLVSLSLLVSAGFLGLHALATPGCRPRGAERRLRDRDSDRAPARCDPSRRFRVRGVEREPRAGRGPPPAVLAGGGNRAPVGWAVWSLSGLPPLDRAISSESATPPLAGLAALGIVLYALAAARYVPVWRARRRALPASVIGAFIFLAEAMVAIAFARNWHASWWEWHLLMLIAFGAVAVAARRQWRDERFSDLYLEETLGRSRDVSVLFADLQGYTSYSERHGAESATAMLNEYYGELVPRSRAERRAEVVLIGDAVMAHLQRARGRPTIMPSAQRAPRLRFRREPGTCWPVIRNGRAFGLGSTPARRGSGSWEPRAGEPRRRRATP